jgi:hypothetical protein
MKEKDRKDAETNADILFATYDMAHEGLDIDRLNTVILTTPKKNIIQSVGRIMRRILKNGDIRPIIIDFSDELSIFKRQGEVRLKDYNESKYEVKVYYVNQDKFMSRKEYLKTFMKFTDDEINKFMEPEDTIIPTIENILDDANDENKVNQNLENNEENKKSDKKIKSKKINKTDLNIGVKEINGYDDYLF